MSEPNKLKEYGILLIAVLVVIGIGFLLGSAVSAASSDVSSQALWIVVLIAALLIFIFIPVFFLVEMSYDSSAFIKLHDLLARFTVITERIFFPKKVRAQLLKLLGNLKGKSILEYGCSIGTLSIDLAEAVGPQGMVYATNHSMGEARIAHRKARRLGHRNVKVIHHPSHTMHLHPAIPKFDAVVSVGMLGYVQNIRRVLSDMNRRMKIKDRVVFLEYSHSLGIVPSADWLSNDRGITRTFAESGFNVAIIRKKGLFWENVFIYGVKYKNVY